MRSANPGTPVETTHAGLRIQQSENGIGEWVWMDANRNGVQDPGEAGLNGVVIELYDVDRQPRRLDGEPEPEQRSRLVRVRTGSVISISG